MNGVLLHLHAATHSSIYLGMLLLHVQNVQVCLVVLWQKIHLQLHEWKWALQFLVDINCRYCDIDQKLFCL